MRSERSILRRGLPSALLIAVILAASPSSARTGGAQTTDNEGAGSSAGSSPQERFGAAQKLFDQGNHAAALDMFRDVYAATKSPNARLMIGHCLVQLGRAAEAYEELAATVLEAAKRAETEPKYDRARDSAATELARLEIKVGKIVVALADPAISEVSLNGTPLSSDKIGVPIAVDPGELIVTAKRPEGGIGRFKAVVRAGETKTVTVVFRDRSRAAASGAASSALDGPNALPPPPPREPAASFVGRGGVRTLGFVAAGVGVAGMALFGVAGAMVKDKLSTLESECGGARCTEPRYADVIDSGKALTTATNVGLAVGVAGLLSGGLMITLGGASKSSEGQKPGVELSAGISKKGGSLLVIGSF